MHHLEEAVLAVLLEANHNSQFVGSAHVSRQTGIFRGGQRNDVIVHAIFHKLNDEGRLKRGAQPNGRAGWALTDDEFARLRTR